MYNLNDCIDHIHVATHYMIKALVDLDTIIIIIIIVSMHAAWYDIT